MKYLFPFFNLKMDEANDGTGGGGSGGSPNNNGNNGSGSGGDGSGGGGSGGDDELSQLRAQLENERKEKKTLQGSLTKLTADIEGLRKANHKAQGDFKALYEDSEKKAGELQGKYDKLKTSVFHTARVGKVKEEALKLGLRQEALSDIEDLDLEELEVAVGDNSIISVNGAKEFTDRLKKVKGHWFKSPDDPAFNAGGGGGSGGGTGGGTKITMEEFQQAYINRNKSPEHMAKYRDMAKKYDEQTKKKA